MTHIQNIPHILEFGFTHQTSTNANRAYAAIGDQSMIATRHGFRLQNERLLGEYIPFYFGCRMPMLYVIQKGFNSVTPTSAENIVYCVSSIEKIVDQDLDFVFTDGHAVDSFSSQFTAVDLEHILDLVDMDAIKARYWKNEDDLDLKRRKEAEFLVLGDIEPSAILGFLVYNKASRDRLTALGIDKALVHVKPDRYF